MATLSPAYRLTVYAPYSVDPTEATALTPYTPVSGGAIHSDAFRVCSVPFISGGTWRPYLDIPDGRHGKLDPLTRAFDKGQFTFRLLDKTTTPGANLTRWLTAFVGDSSGAGLLNGRKLVAEESLDFDQTTGLGTWTAYATGRITSLALDRSRQWYVLQAQDMSTDLDDTLFRGIPRNLQVVPSGTAANCATTAQGPAITPLGTSVAYGSQAAAAGLAMKVASSPGPTSAVLFIDGAESARRAILTKQARALVPDGYPADDILRVDLTWNSGANRGTFKFSGVSGIIPDWGLGGGIYHPWLRSFGVTLLSSASKWGYTAAVPTTGTAVTARVYPIRWQVTKEMPILVSDVHPVTFLRWVLDGYFGDLKDDGTARRPFPRLNPTGAAGDPFYDLEQDASFGLGRWAFTEQTKRRDVLASVCKQFGLALDLDASGKMTITDVRSKAAALAGVLPALTNADTIATDPARWNHARDGAVSRIDCTYYGDQLLTVDEVAGVGDAMPDVASLLVVVDTDGRPLEELNLTERALDAQGKPITIDCTAFRGLFPGEISSPNGDPLTMDREKQLRAQIATVQEEFRRLFGTGPMTASIPCRRTSVVSSIRPGSYATVTIDELPDPTTNRRGGTRLMLCTAREERGLSVVLSFLDCGRNAIASAPSITAALNATDGAHAIDVTTTVSSDGRAIVEYAVTKTSVGVRPADSDARWLRGIAADTNGTATIDGLPSGRRVWLRCSTRPQASKGFARASSYAYLGGTGYLDLTAIAGPTGGATSGTIFKSQVTLTWSNANTSDPVDVFLIQSASAPADWTEQYRVATLPPGSTKYVLGKMSALSGSSYTWFARCRDDQGGVSAGTGTTFTNGASTITAPTPGKLVVTNAAAGAGTYSGGAKGFGIHRFGVELLSVPPDAAYDREIQRAPDSAGSPGTYATIATLTGAETTYVDALPNDGAIYWYRQRCVGNGADPGAYCDGVSATAQPLRATLMLEEGRRQLSTFAASDATLNPGVAVQRDTGGPTATFLTKGLRKGTCRHGDAVTFSPAFAGTPVVWFAETRRDQSAAKWGSISQVDAGTAAGARLAGVDVYPLKIANGLGPSGFTARLLMLQKGTPTTRNFDFSGVAITTAGGTDASAALSTAPAATDQYTVRFKGTIQAKTNIVGLICRLDVVVAIEYRISNVAAYQEVWRTPSPYTVADSSGSTATYNIDESQTVSAPLMTATGNFRIKVISATVSGTGVTSLSIRGKVNASDGAYGVTFYTATNQYASATPDTDDSVEWYAMEGS